MTDNEKNKKLQKEIEKFKKEIEKTKNERHGLRLLKI